MKKLITILAIMIVLVGAVFADNAVGNSTLIVKTTIAEVLPTFGLTAISSNVSSVTQAQYANATAQNNGVTTPIDSQQGYATITDSTNLITANGTVAVQFAVKQISDSSTTRTFHLAAEATNLVRVKDPTTQSNVNVGVGNVSVNTDFSAIDANEMFTVSDSGTVIPAITNGSDVAAALDSTHHIKGSANATTSTTLDVQYDGVKISAYGADNNKQIGVFTVTWNANPNAKPGDYEACVKLTVTSN